MPNAWIRVAAWGVLAALPTSGAGADDVFDVNGKPPTRAVVTIEPNSPGLTHHESDMTRLLAGAVADLHGPDLRRLLACVPLNPFLGDPSGSERVYSVVLVGADEQEPVQRVDLLRSAEGAWIAVAPDSPRGRPVRAELDRAAFDALAAGWPAYRAGFGEGACADPVAQVFELPRPYVPGRFTMDKATLGARFLGRSTTNIDGADRVLDQEALFARLPRGYNPKEPAGLVIWISPTPQGEPPGVFAAALDEAGLICIGAANSGNDRHVSNRHQLVFDALATASRRYHVDPRRVYLTGMSGGGRVASMLVGCFPDVFAGAVPIVGLSCYENVPTGMGGAWPAGYRRPPPDLFALLKRRPIGAITGRRDVNQLEMTHASSLMKRDGLFVRLFDYADMGHEMPTPERFREALAWVDEPWRRTREHERVGAQEAWEAYVKRFGDKPPASEAARRMLVRVTAEGPWTPIAWRAVELLRGAPSTPAGK